MLDKAELREAMEIILRITKARVLPKMEKDEDIDPAMFMLDNDGAVMNVVPLEMPNTHSEKARLELILRAALASEKAAGYVVQFMAWTMPKEAPSEHPNRREILAMSAGSKRAAVSRMFFVRRGEDCKIIDLEEEHSLEMAEAYGLFQDMMGSQTPETKH